MGKQPKYPADEYINFDMPSDDMDTYITGYKSKLVKVRKDSKCVYCGTAIPKGDFALAASGFEYGEAPFYIHYCLECVDDELRNYHGEENQGEEDWREEAFQRWKKRARESGYIQFA